MRRVQKIALFVTPIVALLLFADPALATTYSGEGLFGPTDDAQITETMFGLLIFFPVIIVIFSLITNWGERRRHRKHLAEHGAKADDHA